MPVSGSRLGLVVVCLAALLMPWGAYAASPMTDVLCYILGDVLMVHGLKGFGTIAIAALGAAAMMGKASWGLTVTVACGIALLYGCADIIYGIGLGDAGAVCDWP